MSGRRFGVHAWLLLLSSLSLVSAAEEPLFSEPCALVSGAGGESVYVACGGSCRVLEVSVSNPRVLKSYALKEAPSGVAYLARLNRLLVTTGGADGRLLCLDAGTGQELRSLAAGHTPVSPVFSPTGRRAFVCSRFDHCVREFDLEQGMELSAIAVDREPVSAALTPDGTLLFVANHLHAGRSDTNVVAARVSVIDTALRRVVKEISLPNGSTLMREVTVSPDGKHAAVVHNLARFHLPTTHVTWGWMNNAAVTLIDVEQLERINTVLLDDLNAGAANPWGVAWSRDGNKLAITHAGTHEVTVVDAERLLLKLARLPVALKVPETKTEYFPRAKVRDEVPNDFRFLEGLKQRVKLGGRGPRALTLTASGAVVADYFSDALEVVSLDDPPRGARTLIAGKPSTSLARRGEDLFNDARLCVESWQSCASCHSNDGRVDALNWDLHNDGVGNPKNVRSLLLAFERSPVMSLGVRADAAAAIRAGVRYILFTNLPPEFTEVLDAYVRSLAPVPSPRLNNGELSDAARRGRDIFNQRRTGCSECHTGPLYTDRKQHAVGTGKFDGAGDRFYTPTLIEAWRTAPYLHDGSAATLREVVTSRNAHGLRGRTEHLSEREVDDLVTYLESL